MKRKVLLISYYYPPCAASGVFRTLRFVKHLPEFHWDPVVLTLDPSYYSENEPLDRQLLEGSKDVQAIRTYRTKVMPGAEKLIAWLKGRHVTSKGTSPASRRQQTRDTHAGETPKTLWQKIKDGITLTLMIPDKKNGWLPFALIAGLKAVRKESPSVLYASGGPWTAFLIGYLLKKITGTPLVIDFRDPWVDNPYNEYDFSLRDTINAFLEKHCIKTADVVIANTEPLRSVFIEKYQRFSPDKFVTLTNGYDETEYQELYDEKEVTKTEESPMIISHIGTLYSKRSPEKFLSALSSLIHRNIISQKKIRVKLIGKIEIPGLKETLEQEELSSIVECIDYLPKNEALKASFHSDVLLLIQPDTRLQIPAKLFEYIRLGRPIFAVCGEGATEEIITSNGFGVVARYDDIEDIEAKFRLLYESLIERSKKQEDRKTDFQHEKIQQFDSQFLTAQLAALFEQITKHSYCATYRKKGRKK